MAHGKNPVGEKRRVVRQVGERHHHRNLLESESEALGRHRAEGGIGPQDQEDLEGVVAALKQCIRETFEARLEAIKALRAGAVQPWTLETRCGDRIFWQLRPARQWCRVRHQYTADGIEVAD